MMQIKAESDSKCPINLINLRTDVSQETTFNELGKNFLPKLVLIDNRVGRINDKELCNSALKNNFMFICVHDLIK